MPAKTERYRFVRWEIEDVNGVARMLPGGFAEVTRGGGLKYERVVFLGPSGKSRTEVHLNSPLTKPSFNRMALVPSWRRASRFQCRS